MSINDFENWFPQKFNPQKFSVICGSAKILPHEKYPRAIRYVAGKWHMAMWPASGTWHAATLLTNDTKHVAMYEAFGYVAGK